MPKYICRKPGPKSIGIIKRDEKVSSPSLQREYSFVYKKAKGMHVWDVDDRKYLDFAAGIAVMNIGHNNPTVQRAIANQMKRGMHIGFGDFYAELPVVFEEKMLEHLPKNLNKMFLSNSGTESVEAAIKLAKWHTKKKWMIAFEPSFHGRTMGSLALTKSKPVFRERFDPFMPVKHVPYPYPYQMFMEPNECSDFCLDHVEKELKFLKGDCAAVFLEPVAGESGYMVPPRKFVKGLRELCDSYDALLCADEVQSGAYRTGKFLAMENFGVKPDIVSMSKAIGGGLPLGATIASSEIMDWPPGSHSNTFGGNLLSCASGIATLDYMKSKKLDERAVKMGSFMMKRLEEMKDKYEIVGDVRGLGLMIGIEIVEDKRSRTQDESRRNQILCKASEKGLILLGAGKSTIRICPPLIITKEQAEKGIDILEDSIREVM